MSSASEVTPWPRHRSLGQTRLKGRQLMKLEWNKLFAEATEKDTEEHKGFNFDEMTNNGYDDCDIECEENGENESNYEMPLNLCHKSNTVPNMSTQFEISENSIEFSTEKKAVGSNKVYETPKQMRCSVPNLSSNNRELIVKNNNFSANNTPACKEPLQRRDDSENVGIIKVHNNGMNSVCNFNGHRTPMKELNILELNAISESKNISADAHPFSAALEKPLNDQLPKQFNNCIVHDSSRKEEEQNFENITNNDKSDYDLYNDQPKRGSKKFDGEEEKALQNAQARNHVRFAVPSVPEKARNVGKTLVVNGKPYQILAPLGKGGSSYVYLVLNTNNELLAVKCVKLSGVSESVKNDYLNEIQHLMRMQHSKHVIRLYDHQYVAAQKLLYAVMEKGDTDLSRFLKDKAASEEGITPELILYYWNEMLLAVKSIHDNNIIHRDLKPANFLLVSGRLKLIDFGIASSIQNEQTSVLMDTQSGTFNYMSPEALLDLGSGNEVVLKIGRKSDVWSLGCILYYFLYKRTPYQDIVKPLQKMKAITDPKYAVKFPKLPGVPNVLIESCRRCLLHDKNKRASIEELLELKNRPLLTLSQVLEKLESSLSEAEYAKAKKALSEEIEEN